MNGRFSRLEFGAGEKPEHQESLATDKRLQGTITRSAEHFLDNARIARRRGEFEPALQLFTRALREDRARVPAWVGQVQMLIELSEYAEARLWCDKALEVFRMNGDLLAAKSVACLRQGDIRSASVCSDVSVQSPGASPLRWQARGELLLRQGESRARDCFDKSLTEVGADWFDRVVVARIYLFYDKPAAAIEFATLATGLAPAEVYAWTVRAACQHELGDQARAIESCRRALEIDARFAPAKALLGSVQNSRTGIFRRIKGWFR